MARPKEFDTDVALDAAVGVFGEHGFEGSSSAMLVEAMGIGRQSLYDTFGDYHWLYVASAAVGLGGAALALAFPPKTPTEPATAALPA